MSDSEKSKVGKAGADKPKVVRHRVSKPKIDNSQADKPKVVKPKAVKPKVVTPKVGKPKVSNFEVGARVGAAEGLGARDVDGGGGPSIDGPATEPQPEELNTGQQDDLDSSIPDTGIALGGDGKRDRPWIRVPGVFSGGLNPLQAPQGSRPLPTGTAIGPRGEHYGFYAFVPYLNPDGTPHGFTAPDTVVVNLANPGVLLYTLRGISQASGAYDSTTRRMIIMGNNADGNHRGLWGSAPAGQNGDWSSTLQSLGAFEGDLDGDRESQIVALPQGGFLMVGAADSQPIVGAAAATPEGLLGAPSTQLVPQMNDDQFSYGPTITGIRPGDGNEVVTLRVSTFGVPLPNGDPNYDPHTYTATFTVTP